MYQAPEFWLKGKDAKFAIPLLTMWVGGSSSTSTQKMIPGCTVEACSFRDNSTEFTEPWGFCTGCEPRYCGESCEVSKQTQAKLPTPCGYYGRSMQSLRSAEGEVDVRQEIHRYLARYLPHRSERKCGEGVSRGESTDALS